MRLSSCDDLKCRRGWWILSDWTGTGGLPNLLLLSLFLDSHLSLLSVLFSRWPYCANYNILIYFRCDVVGLALIIWKITTLMNTFLLQKVENGVTWCKLLVYVTENRKDLSAEILLVLPLFLSNNELRFRIWLRSIDFCFCIQCRAALARLEYQGVCEGY